MRARLPTAWLAALLLLACALSFVTAARAQGARPINAVTELFIEDPVTHVRMGIGSNTVVTDSQSITPQMTIAFTDPPERKLYFALLAPACNADPFTVEQLPITLTATPSGFTQQLIGIETTPNSALFRIQPVASNPSTKQASPGALQTAQPGDTITITFAGCGNVSVNSVVIMNRRGVVYDAVTKAPVAGARVKLIDVSGGSNGGSAGNAATVYAYDTVTTLPSEVVTGADGRYYFQLTVPSTYRLSVTPPAAYSFPSTVAPGAPGSQYAATAGASYGADFVLGVDHIGVDYNIPLDRLAPAQTGSLSTQITVSTPSAEIADSVEYVVTVRNTGQLDFPNVELDGSLPFGFAYIPGSARLEGGFTLAPPTGTTGPNPVFQLGPIGVGDSRLLHLRARLTAGAPRGNGTARAQARAALPVATTSNVASVKVKVDPGVFSDQAMVLGTVFADCNANGVQDPGELGAPGVRLYLEDGTSAVTDGAGRYSFYGLSPRTHVLKIDATSLPDGAEPVAISQRNAGDGASRFVDVQRGELHRADFALRGCSEALAKQLRARRAAQGDRELGTALKTELKPGTPAALGDLRALPAQGLVASRRRPPGPRRPRRSRRCRPRRAPPRPRRRPRQRRAPTLDSPRPFPPSPSRPPEPAKSAAAPVDLETLAANADNQLAFVELKDGDVVGAMPRSVRIKGRLGATLGLQVNGVALGADRIGRTVRSDDKQAEWQEYIGVTLRPGDNVLALTETDPFGHVRGNQTIHVTVPGAVARLVVTPAAAHADADGKSTVAVRVEAFDAAGLRITDRLAVTLQTSAGQWNERDLDLHEPGVQTIIEGEVARLALQAPAAPGDARLVVSAGAVKGEARVEFGPVLRPMMAVGIVEGALNLRHLSAGAVQPASGSDGFEQELHQYAGGANGGAAARAALFLKGKVRGDYLLTLGYDSDKSTQQGLFRDIQPDAFYPVYGDSSVRGFDAQSTGKLYVRVEKDKSYLLYGDFTTQSINPARQLGAYQRSLSGLKEHYEAGAAQVNAFASRDSSVQVIDELRADGTSGPFLLRSPGLVENSEKVEILVRDRSQPALIVKTTPLERFTDYDIDALTRLLLRAPVPSLDPDLNPESIRITYEVDQGGPKFWVAGVDGQVGVTDFLELGGSYVTDRNPLDPFRLESVNSTVKFDDKTQLIAEEARVAKELEGSGAAQRVEFKHEGPGLKARVYATRSDLGFDNPSATIGKGRSEGGAKVDYALDERTRLVGEALHTGDRSTGSRRDGVLLGVERSFDGGTKVELGARRVRDDAAVQGQATTDTTSLRAKVTASVPGVTGATAFVEAEQDVHDTAKRLLAVGGDYRLANGGKLYLRHELISSLSGPYALDATQRRNSTLIGVDTEYMQDGRVFSEYRGREAFDGRETEAAIGLKNRWLLADGLRLNTSFERVQTLSAPTGDTTDGTANAVTGAIEYTANPLWKGTARLELRDGVSSRSVLSTFGIAAKLSADWTFLGKNAYALTQPKNAPAATTATNPQQPTHVQERFQLGAAYRDSETNRVNGLVRYEFKQERGATLGDTGSRGVHIVSAHADYQPQRELTLTGHVAAKLVHETIDGAPSRSTAELVGGRATWELARDWDVGASANLLATGGLRSRQSSLGGEAGYQVQKNLWVSAGYNVTGFKDRDLSAENYTSRGVYLRVRFKFDENLFASK